MRDQEPPPPIEDRCLAYLDGLVESLRALVPKAMKHWELDAIHDARVTTRRLKAALDLLAPVLPPVHRMLFGQALRRLRRRLGPLRDADVMLEHLQQLRKVRGHAPAADWLSDQVRQQRDTLRQKCQRRSQTSKVLSALGVWWGLHEELGAADKTVRTMLTESIPRQISAFASGAAQLVQVVHAPRADDTSHGDDPHALRVTGKALRYSLELALVVDCPIPPAALSCFKRMQNALGLWHDYLVLSEAAVTLVINAQIPGHNQKLYGQLLDLSKLAWKRAQHQLRQFAVVWDKSGRELTQAILDLFPAAHPSDEPGQETTGQVCSVENSAPASSRSDVSCLPSAPPPHSGQQSAEARRS